MPPIYYPLHRFSVYKEKLTTTNGGNNGLHFPEYLMVSTNHYHMQWTNDRSLRRLKNVMVVMEWAPGKVVPANSGVVKMLDELIKGKQWSSGQPPPAIDAALHRCFALFDTDSDGQLSAGDCERVIAAMGINFVTAPQLLKRYGSDIQRLGDYNDPGYTSLSCSLDLIPINMSSVLN